MVAEMKDPTCAVCGKLIERGEPRYRLLVEGELASAHVECRNKANPDQKPKR